MTSRVAGAAGPRFLFATAFACLALCLAAPDAFAQQPSASPTPAATPDVPALAKIEFIGLSRVKQEEATEATGLQAGQPIDVDLVDAAAARLLDSGLFRKLSYSFRAAKGQATVVFTVEEMAARAPVVFDNFVWFSDRELDEYLRQSITGYDGTAADAGTMTEKIARALGEMLLLKGIKGRVEYSPSADPSGRNPSHLFAVRGATGLRVCSVSFPGAAAVKEQVLVQQSGVLVANEYSRQAALAFAETNLLPLYRERGNLRAAFRTPQARPATEDDCLGVALSVPVDEGVAYVWEKSEWSGNEALPAAALDAALGMRPRELVNLSKIEKGLEAARKLYARKGHLAAKLQPTFVFDDAARSVTYRVGVVEGPQYRMGELFVTGLSEKDTNNLRGRWSLLPREVYDAEYLDGFLKKAVAEFLRDPSTDAHALGKLKPETSVRADKDKLTVDVTIDFKQQK